VFPVARDVLRLVHVHEAEVLHHFDVGGAGLNGSDFTVFTNKAESIPQIADFRYNPITGVITPIYGTPQSVTGFRLVDARASYGFGLETFLLGYPMHFDWSWRTLFNKDWEDVLYAADGGSAKFRKPRFAMWIGYDF